MFLFIQHEAEASLNFHLLIMCLVVSHHNTLGLELFGSPSFQRMVSPFLLTHFKQLSKECSRRKIWWPMPKSCTVTSTFSAGNFLKRHYLTHI